MFLRRIYNIVCKKEKVTKRDFGWIIVILLLAIVLLCCLIVSGNPNASNILSVVSTGISIVLSIIAIVYTFISGIQSSDLNSETKTQIMLLQKEVENLKNSIEKKIQIQNEVDSYIESVSPLISKIAQNTDGTLEIDEVTQRQAQEISEQIRRDFENDE